MKVAIQGLDFKHIDTDAASPVYHCVLDDLQLWLIHPLAKNLYHHPTFRQDFAAAWVSALTSGYHQFDALVLASIYASKEQSDKASVPYQGFPGVSLALPSKTPSIENHSTNLAPIGLYPIVDASSWLPRLADTGVRTIQLRIKDLTGKALEQEIARAVSLAQTYGFNVFINDYWQLAIKHQAYGVHLGQEDLTPASVQAIADAGLRLGISTHCHFEVARAHWLNPDYIAIGPVFATQTKAMAFQPQGLAALAYWRKHLSQPLVAIAGIDADNIGEVADCLNKQTDGIAMISAITQAKDPKRVARDLCLALV